MFGAVCFVAAIPFLTDNTYRLNVLILIFLLAVMASGWNIMAGYAGYISLGLCVHGGGGVHRRHPGHAVRDVSPLPRGAVGWHCCSDRCIPLGSGNKRAHVGPAFVIVSFAMLELLGLARQELVVGDGRDEGFLMPLPAWDVSLPAGPSTTRCWRSSCAASR